MLSEEVANKIYDILVRDCNVSEIWREHFVIIQTQEFCREFRFGGEFGFGGKFWRNDDRWYVNYYRENQTNKLDKMQEIANTKLAELKVLYPTEY